MHPFTENVRKTRTLWTVYSLHPFPVLSLQFLPSSFSLLLFSACCFHLSLIFTFSLCCLSFFCSIYHCHSTSSAPLRWPICLFLKSPINKFQYFFGRFFLPPYFFIFFYLPIFGLSFPKVFYRSTNHTNGWVWRILQVVKM